MSWGGLGKPDWEVEISVSEMGKVVEMGDG